MTTKSYHRSFIQSKEEWKTEQFSDSSIQYLLDVVLIIYHYNQLVSEKELILISFHK
jgi:hypothetical protein